MGSYEKRLSNKESSKSVHQKYCSNKKNTVKLIPPPFLESVVLTDSKKGGASYSYLVYSLSRLLSDHLDNKSFLAC